MKKTSSRRATQDSFRAMYDPVLRFMQTTKARKGMRAAFNATPTELGRAALIAARKIG